MSCIIRTSIHNSFRRKKIIKNSKTADILGCSYDDLIKHLENKFEPWMDWNNRGLYNGTENYGWDIDHIIPIASATCEADVIRLNHYTNLQPLCSRINRDIKR
jgi:exonuclease III